MTPMDMKRSIGVISVCGQLASRPNSMRHLPASATLASHNSLRCGSIARDLTVFTPKIVSPSTEARLVSASITLLNTSRRGRRKAKMISAIIAEQATTSHARVVLR